MGMQALQLDFHAARRVSPWIGRGLLVVALAFGAQVASSYVSLRDDVSSSEEQLASLSHAGGAAHTSARPVTSEDMRAARETVDRLSLSWDNLFGALEANPASDVALLSIEPDAKSGTALIMGEAEDYAAALRYVSRLNGAKGLRRVHLVKHELRQGSTRPVAFSVSVAWRDAR
jgi:hypothetical protein